MITLYLNRPESHHAQLPGHHRAVLLSHRRHDRSIQPCARTWSCWASATAPRGTPVGVPTTADDQRQGFLKVTFECAVVDRRLLGEEVIEERVQGEVPWWASAVDRRLAEPARAATSSIVMASRPRSESSSDVARRIALSTSSLRGRPLVAPAGEIHLTQLSTTIYNTIRSYC